MNEDSRLLPLVGGFNLRDCGGYATEDGQRVKRGMLFRSGVMSMLTEEDDAHLTQLGIASICDLRRGDERSMEPTAWHEGSETEYWTHDYEESSGVLSAMLDDPTSSPGGMRDTMIEVYREIPEHHAPAYRAMFERLAGGRIPLLVNCSAGKDRTGVAVALILSSLGVPRETVVRDYLLTNDYADFQRLLATRRSFTRKFANLPPEMIAPILAADPDYLDAMFEVLDTGFGGLEGYLSRKLGIDSAALDRIRGHLLEA